MDTWMTLMRRGDFAAAWALSDAERRARGADAMCWHLPRHLQWVWNGSPLAGRRVMVRCYHGLGDTVQFIRYAAPLRAVAAEVIAWAQPELVSLVQSARGVDRALPLHDGTPEADFDVDVEIMELPYIFRSSPETLPADVPYLHVEPARSGPCAEPRHLAVGLVWRAGDWDERRSIPAPLLAPLAQVSGIDWRLLQRGAARTEHPAGFGIDSGSDDVTQAAQVMRALDLVISVDSLPAHLAGALGVPVWTLLPADADWRWMEGRSDSPWYPTMRLFRQDARHPGDWRPVIRRVAEALRRRCAGAGRK